MSIAEGLEESGHASAPPAPSALKLTALRRVVMPLAGIGIVVGLWWLGGLIIESTPHLSAFHGFTVGTTLQALWQMIVSGDAAAAAGPSLSRVLQGLFWAFVIGTPAGCSTSRSVRSTH